MLYKAEVEIIDSTQSGWDTYVDSQSVLLEATSVPDLKDKISKLHRDDSHGDFGICLASREVKVIKSWQVVQKEIIKPVVL